MQVTIYTKSQNLYTRVRMDATSRLLLYLTPLLNFASIAIICNRLILQRTFDANEQDEIAYNNLTLLLRTE